MTQKEKTDLLKRITEITSKVNKAKAEPKPVQKYMTTEEKSAILNELKNLANILNKIN